MNARTLRLLVFGCGLACSLACSEDAPTTPPVALLPPEVVAVEPEARATRVWYDTSIWAEFATPLDPSTVSTRTVFLKQDTQRMTSIVSYDSVARRILIEPQVPLPLDRTLTVELGPALRTAEGGSFGGTYYWQFKTNSLRRIERIGPDDGATFESPSVAMLWAPTEATAGTINYQLYVSTDSSQVAARTVAPRTLTKAEYLPTPKWTEGARMFWSIRVRNLSTGEALEGPVWSFETVPAGTPVDSVSVPMAWWGVLNKRTNALNCGSTSVTTFSDVITAVRWQLESAPPGLRLQSVRMYATSTTTLAASRSPSLTPAQADLPFCDIRNPGPPFADFTYPTVTAGVTGGNPLQLHYESDFFTAHVQATLTYGGFYGYVMTSGGTVSYANPVLTLIYYRLPPAAAATSIASR